MEKGLHILMQDKDIRKALGLRLRRLRKKKEWTQKELAEKLDIRFSLLNKYECGVHVPPIEKLIKFAEVFHTTVDFLVTGDNQEETPLHNLRLLKRFQSLQNIHAEDQETVIKLIDAILFKQRIQGVVKAGN